jgi:hypothetical protein
MSITRTKQALFTPVRMGVLELRNRVIMAPLTRMRAANSGHVRPPIFTPNTTPSAPLLVSSSANAPRSALMLTVGLILLAYGALSRFAAGAGLLMPSTRRVA